VLEYLDYMLLEAKRLLPTQGEARWEVLRWHALAHGLIDAKVTRLLDLRRPEPLKSAEVRAREEVRIARTLDSLEKDIAARQWACLNRLTLAHVALGVARVELEKPSGSIRSIHTVSIGASISAAREARTHSLR
jgi:glutathione S-transferase